MSKRPKIELVPLGELDHFNGVVYEDDTRTLRYVLQHAPSMSTVPISEEWLDLELHQIIIRGTRPTKDTPLYWPPDMNTRIALPEHEEEPSSEDQPAPTSPSLLPSDLKAPPQDVFHQGSLQAPKDGFPKERSEKDAVRLAYSREIDNAASFIHAGLSVLVLSDKLVVEHLGNEIALRSQKNPQMLRVPEQEEGGLMPRGLRQRQLIELKSLIKRLKEGDVLVISHLDLLAGGDAGLSTEARELIELIYEDTDRLVLAFADRTLEIPEVLAARFAVRLLITGVSRTVTYPDGHEALLGSALVTADEVKHFTNFDPEGLYKNVAGMNPIRIRDAIKYAKGQAIQQYDGEMTADQLYQAIRAFKAQTSAKFEVPDVSFEDIGGYEAVKAELGKALRLMTGAYQLPNEKIRNELLPRGFIFYGPPGTGKTLFAKAVANQLNATIQVVSGPEVTDMYVGESERKIRELFAEARRNAPSVLVFDEFDSIASRRSGSDDGGSRVGNALVAQILTEMDGFRPDVPVLVIGTTNRLDIVDEALLRPSRFKAVEINLPTTEARRAIAEVHAKHFDISVSSDLLDAIAHWTQGFNGDEIRALFREACVGLYCEDPPLELTEERFETLVNQLKKASKISINPTSIFKEKF